MFSDVVKRLLQQKKTTKFSRINKRNYLGRVDDVLIEGKKEWTRISKITQLGGNVCFFSDWS